MADPMQPEAAAPSFDDAMKELVQALASKLVEGGATPREAVEVAKKTVSQTPRPQRSWMPEVGAGEHGLPYMPPLPENALGRPTEVRSALMPLSEAVADYTNNPLAGQAVDAVARFGRDTGEALPTTGLARWGLRKADRLSDSVSDMLKEGIVTTADAQPAKEDPLAPLRQRAQDLKREYDDAIARRNAATPKGMAPNPNNREQNPRYWQADDDAKAVGARREALDAEIGNQTKLHEDRESRLAGEEQSRLGNERWEAAQRSVGPVQKMIRDDAELLGAAGGAVGGHLVRSGIPILNKLFPSISGGIVGRYNERLGEQATRANALMDGPQGRDWSSRIGRANQFATEGQPPQTLAGRVMGREAPQEPFTRAPATAKGFEVNPNAPAASQLYQPDRAGNALKDLGIAGVGVAESGIAHYGLTAPAQAELSAAQTALDKDKSQANIDRYMAAKDALAYAKMIELGGRGFSAGYVGSSAFHPRDQARPNVNAYAAEEDRIRQWLQRGDRGGGPSRGPGPAPKQSAPASGSSSNQASPPPNVRIPEGHTWAGPSNPTQTRIIGKYGPKLPDEPN